MQLNAKQESHQEAPKTAKKTILVSDSSKESTTSSASQDEDILAELKTNSKKSKTSVFIIAAPIVVIVVLFLVVMLVRGRHRAQEGMTSAVSSVATSEQYGSAAIDGGDAYSSANQTDTVAPGVGTQDFTRDTTMVSDSPLTNPDQYLEDLYGLTTSVDYNVREIKYATDFVSYTKYRGTWGGGLELYWLNVDYKGRPYVIQVPFKYYKELTDTGIVPVKMEVLKIRGSADEDLTVISYMSLDEETLQSVLETQTTD